MLNFKDFHIVLLSIKNLQLLNIFILLKSESTSIKLFEFLSKMFRNNYFAQNSDTYDISKVYFVYIYYHYIPYSCTVLWRVSCARRCSRCPRRGSDTYRDTRIPTITIPGRGGAPRLVPSCTHIHARVHTYTHTAQVHNDTRIL